MDVLLLGLDLPLDWTLQIGIGDWSWLELDWSDLIILGDGVDNFSETTAIAILECHLHHPDLTALSIFSRYATYQNIIILS